MAESTQRFSGRTLEDAIGKATDALGSGVEVVEAKRVRRGGVFGKLQNETFEVAARARPGGARPSPARRSASFDNALRDMIDEVDLREERQVLKEAPQRKAATSAQARSHATTSSRAARSRLSTRFSEDDLVPLPPEPARPKPARVVASARPAMTEETLPPPPAVGTAGSASIDLREQRSAGPKWSSQRLRDLRVPEAIIDLMPVASLDGDVAWTVALEAAIRARLPLTPTVPLAVHGYGDNAAVQMLESALQGYAIGDLHLLDRVVPATPFELALAIRACLSR